MIWAMRTSDPGLNGRRSRSTGIRSVVEFVTILIQLTSFRMTGIYTHASGKAGMNSFPLAPGRAFRPARMDGYRL
jgi:hypothetical protein